MRCIVATLQQTFEYAGDATGLAVDTIEICAQIPRFHYERADGGGVTRTIVGQADGSTRVLPTASRYLLSLPDAAVTGGTLDQAVLWNEMRAQALRSGNVDDLAFPLRMWARLAESVIWSRVVDVVPVIRLDAQEGAPGRVVLVLRDALNNLASQLADRGIGASEDRLLGLIDQAHNESGPSTFEADKIAFNPEIMTKNMGALGLGPQQDAVEVMGHHFPGLTDFAVQIPAIEPLRVAGVFEVRPAGGEPLDPAFDFSSYRLTVDYALANADDPAAPTTTEVIDFDWSLANKRPADRAADFTFSQLNRVPTAAIASPVTVSALGFDGAVLWRQAFDAGAPQLSELRVDVDARRPVIIEAAPTVRSADGADRLRGKVVSMDAGCKLEGIAVVVAAATAGPDGQPHWTTVGAATTDPSGAFSMPFPTGDFIDARAAVSAAPDAPTKITVHTDRPGRSIDDGFLYLLIDTNDSGTKEDCGCGGGDGDCGCTTLVAAPRLPSHSDLIGSDKFSQDIGGSCINLTTPNRTIQEYAYSAIVRTSDPDVSRYVIDRHVQVVWNPPDEYEFHNYVLRSDGTVYHRDRVAVHNPILWNDVPAGDSELTFYQAESVATGHVLHYRAEFRADGYSLGNLVYSLPLAPGQKKQIAVFESSHELSASESQRIAQGESLAASLVDDRATTDALGGSLSEGLSGSSSSSTGGVSAGLGLGATLGAFGGSLGVAGGYASSSANSSQQGSRETAQHFGEKLRRMLMQNAQSYRDLNASVVTQVQQGQSYSATTEVVANHNHCHSLTMMYFEVLRHFAIFQELASVEECVFVPLILTAFGQENIYKWRDVLIDHLLPLRSNTYFRPFGSTAHPLAGAFDANERIRTNYANVDFPEHRYCDDTIDSISGQVTLRVQIPRPPTRFDRILSLPIIRKQVTTQGGVDVAGTISDGIKSSVVGALTGGLSLLFGGGPDVKYTQDTKEVLTPGKIFDHFMTLDENYETVPPARCIRVHGFQPLSFLDVNGNVGQLDLFADTGDGDDAALWDSYAGLLGMSRTELLSKFYGNVIGDWDRIWDREIAPRILEALVTDGDTLAIEPLTNLDLTQDDSYSGGDRRITYSFTAETTSTRAALTELTLEFTLPSTTANAQRLKDAITLRVTDLIVNYTTPHYRGRIFSSRIAQDLIGQVLTPPFISVHNVKTPMNSDEKRNPRKEDAFLVTRLVDHLNSNVEYYNRVLWARLDSERRFMLLDGFAIQTYDDAGAPLQMRSIASVVRNEPIDVAGNSVVFPVAAGYRVSPSFVAGSDGDPGHVTLLDHYRPLTEDPPYRLSVPSRGVYLEAVKGVCDACEAVEEHTSQDWDRFRTDEPTSIAPVVPPTPEIIDWKAAFLNLAAPIVGMQVAPTEAAPGAGLASLAALLGQESFRDATGLAKTQDNVMQTYLSNQENAKSFAEMAKDLAQQQHNTQNSARIMETAKEAHQSGAMNDDQYGQAVRDHVQKQIDGRSTADIPERADTASRSALADAAAQQVAKNATIDVTQDHRDGTATTVKQSGTPQDASTSGPASGGNQPLIEIERQDPTKAGSWMPVPASEGPGFAMFDHTFDASGAVGLDFPDRDKGQFRIVLTDPTVTAASSATRSVKWTVVFDPAVGQANEPLANTDLVLQQDPNLPERFVSPPLAIVASKEDLPASTASSSGGRDTKGSANYRVRVGGMFSFLMVEGAGAKLQRQVLSPKQISWLPIHVFVLKQNGATLVSDAHILKRLQGVQLMYEPFGIFLNTQPYTFSSTQTTTYKPTSRTLTGPVSYLIHEVDVTGTFDGTKMTMPSTTVAGSAADTSKLSIAFPPNAGGPVIRVFFFQDLAANSATPSPKIRAFAMNTSFTKGIGLSSSDADVVRNSLYVDSAQGDSPVTVAHELGHLLMDKLATLGKDAGGEFTHHFNSPNADYPRDQNLMRSGTSNDTAIGASKRIWDVPDKDGYNWYQDLMTNVRHLRVTP